MTEQEIRERIINAVQCGNETMPGDRCEYCPYGYGYLDETGDHAIWWCNTDKIMEDAVALLKALSTSMDAIDRTAAINAAIEAADEWDGGWNPNREEIIRERLENLPAVIPTTHKISKSRMMPSVYPTVNIIGGSDFWHCGKCGANISKYQDQCASCGRMVYWN